MTSVITALPFSLYEELLSKLVIVIELTQQPGGISTPQARQKLLQATNDFKSSIARAKELAMNLPGGELVTQDQDEIIELLETLRERKRNQLAEFSSRNVSSSSTTQDIKMEIDSTASTPFNA